MCVSDAATGPQERDGCEENPAEEDRCSIVEVMGVEVLAPARARVAFLLFQLASFRAPATFSLSPSPSQPSSLELQLYQTRLLQPPAAHPHWTSHSFSFQIVFAAPATLITGHQILASSPLALAQVPACCPLSTNP